MILCIETSAQTCSAAIADSNGKCLAECTISTTGEHAAMLTTAIGNVVRQAGADYATLEAVAVSNGPGSYTGLRIGLSTAKGICYAHKLPLITLSTLQITAARLKQELALGDADDHSVIIPLMDARRMEVYTQQFSLSLQPLTEPEAMIVDETSFQTERGSKKVYFCGDGTGKCAQVMQTGFVAARADVVAHAKYMGGLAAEALKNKQFADVAYSEPFYLKEYNAVVSKNKVLGL